ncbi:putative smar5 [Trichonephila clavipes]|nr:putative smar5 [Trichonephila clavipes]
MVWGSFSAAAPGTLHFIEERMHQNVYLDILKTNLPLWVQKLSLGNNWRFYQDNDPKHKAYRVCSWLLYNCPHVMEIPLKAPDINPIENLWDHLIKNSGNTVSSKLS